jgi:hypothetical protein
MVSGIVPIWVTSYAQDIIKLDSVSALDENNNKYHIYDNEFGEFIPDQKKRKMRGIFYALIIVIVFASSHYMAINFSGESASFYPPYIEKKIVYPELYEK